MTSHMATVLAERWEPWSQMNAIRWCSVSWRGAGPVMRRERESWRDTRLLVRYWRDDDEILMTEYW